MAPHRGATRHQETVPPLSITAVKLQMYAISKPPIKGESGSPLGFIAHPPTIPQAMSPGHIRSPGNMPPLWVYSLEAVGWRLGGTWLQ